jgi:hypothetical protein
MSGPPNRKRFKNDIDQEDMNDTEETALANGVLDLFPTASLLSSKPPKPSSKTISSHSPPALLTSSPTFPLPGASKSKPTLGENLIRIQFDDLIKEYEDSVIIRDRALASFEEIDSRIKSDVRSITVEEFEKLINGRTSFSTAKDKSIYKCKLAWLQLYKYQVEFTTDEIKLVYKKPPSNFYSFRAFTIDPFNVNKKLSSWTHAILYLFLPLWNYIKSKVSSIKVEDNDPLEYIALLNLFNHTVISELPYSDAELDTYTSTLILKVAKVKHFSEVTFLDIYQGVSNVSCSFMKHYIEDDDDSSNLCFQFSSIGQFNLQACIPANTLSSPFSFVIVSVTGNSTPIYFKSGTRTLEIIDIEINEENYHYSVASIVRVINDTVKSYVYCGTDIVSPEHGETIQDLDEIFPKNPTYIVLKKVENKMN